MSLRRAAPLLLLGSLGCACLGLPRRHPLSERPPPEPAFRPAITDTLEAMRQRPKDWPVQAGECSAGSQRITWFGDRDITSSRRWAYDERGALVFLEERSFSDVVVCLPAATDTYGERPACEAALHAPDEPH